jgi:hypothetical protein
VSRDTTNKKISMWSDRLFETPQERLRPPAKELFGLESLQLELRSRVFKPDKTLQRYIDCARTGNMDAIEASGLDAPPEGRARALEYALCLFLVDEDHPAIFDSSHDNGPVLGCR